MKINLDQLPYYLTKELAPVYLLSGDETLLVEEARAMINQAATTQGVTAKESFTVEKGFAWQDLLLSLRNLSFFSEKTLVELRIANIKLDTAGAAVLQNYLAKPAKDKILLLIVPKLAFGWQKIKWLKTIETEGVFLPIWPISASQLPGWIIERCKRQGLLLNSAAGKILAERAEGNLLAAAQEIEKLILLYGTGKLATEQVVAAVDDNAHYNIFDLVDAALQGEQKKVLAMLDNLNAEGMEPILILWALARELRVLIGILESRKQGQSLEQAVQEQQVMTKRIPLVKRAVAKHSLLDLTLMLKQAAAIDRMIKGVAFGQVWQELTRLTLRLAGDV